MDTLLWIVEILQSLKFIFVMAAGLLSVPLVLMACGVISQDDKDRISLILSVWFVAVLLAVLIPSAEVLGY